VVAIFTPLCSGPSRDGSMSLGVGTNSDRSWHARMVDSEKSSAANGRLRLPRHRFQGADESASAGEYGFGPPFINIDLKSTNLAIGRMAPC
jgi:hypothetical protein